MTTSASPSSDYRFSAHRLAFMQLMEEARQHQHRRLLILQGEPTQVRALARHLLDTLPETRERLIVTGAPDAWPALPCIRNPDYTRCLGKTVGCLVLDSYSGFSAEAMAALSGCIGGGGCLIWLLPETRDIDAFQDPECERLFAYPSEPERSRNAYLRYVLASLSEETALTCWSLAKAAELKLSSPLASVVATEDTPPHEQAEAVQAILETARSRSSATLLLTADRGRGKSAALGLAAGFLLQEGPLSIVLTGHHPDVVQTVFEHAAPMLSHLPVAPQTRGARFSALQLGDGALRYMPPDELLHQSPDCDVLFIDEAAALPISVVEQLLQRYGRVVLSTTLAGYEGSGQGFRLRFLPRLVERCPHLQELTLNVPIRWAEGDPLERWINRTLLCQSASDGRALRFDAADGFQKMDWTQAWQSPDSIQAIFSLMALAHYRTTPEDLRLMLDSPGLETFVLIHEGNLASVALVACEPKLDDAALREQCLKGERRPRGLLSPMAFLQQMGLASALDLNMARIVRIVVAPEYQRKGLGKRFIEHLCGHYQASGVDLLTASFSLFPEVTPFWYHCGFSLARVGQRRDHVSATHSLLVARTLSPAGADLLKQARADYQRRITFDLAYHWSDLSDAELTALLPYFTTQFPLSSEQEAMIEMFCSGALSYEAVEPLLQQLALDRLAIGKLAPEMKALWLWRCIRQHHWSWVCRESLFKGKAVAVQALRRSARALLATEGV